MLFKTFWGVERNLFLAAYSVFPCVILLILYSGNFVVLDQLRILFFWDCEIMIIQSSLVSDLLWNKLRMVSSWDAFVNEFLLVRGNHQVCVYELSHLYVVCENIEGQVLTLCNCYEFIVWVVFFVWSIYHCVFVIGICAVFKSGNWSENLPKNLIFCCFFVPETTLLPIEKFSHSKSMRHGGVLR